MAKKEIDASYYDHLVNLNFHYPHYESPFIVSINENYSQWMEQYCYRWVIDHIGISISNRRHFIDSIQNSDLGLYSACTFTTANWHRLEKLIKWCILFFILDDYHEATSIQSDHNKQFWQALIKMLNNLAEKKSIDQNNWPEFIKAIETILKEIFFDFNAQQIDRTVQTIKHYIDGNILETDWFDQLDTNNNKTILANDNILPDWNCYMKARLGSVGGQMTLQLIEYAKNITLTNQQWNHPLMKTLVVLVSEEMVLVNDYFTFRKEVAENSYKFSSMRHAFSILVNQGLTLQEAVDKVHSMIQEKDQQINTVMEQIISRSELNLRNGEKTNDMKLFLTGVQEVIGGYWRFAITARRYHGKNFIGAIAPSGRFIYDPNETIIDNETTKKHQYTWLRPIPVNKQPK